MRSTMRDRDGTKHSGDFQLADGSILRGELLLQGAQTTLELHSSEYFDAQSDSITGVLYDRTKVSLINCVRLQTSTHSRHGEKYYSATLFPHFVLFGEEHLKSTDERIAEIHFIVDDAATLFNDYTTFGMVLNAKGYIDSMIKANDSVLGYREPATIGANPEIFYFTGKYEIFHAKTAIGEVTATNNPSVTMPGPKGFTVQNHIYLNIALQECISTAEATRRLICLLRFMEIVVGRPQNIVDLRLRIASSTERPLFLDFYWCMPPKRKESHEDRAPHPADTLINVAAEPEYFSDVLQRWVGRHPEWQEARMRFASCFSAQSHYDIDRLVSAANMFDILPSSAFQPSPDLPLEIAAARDNARDLFLALPESPERDSVLGALGRISKHVLKRKVRSRAYVLRQLAESRFPDLELVLDKTIECRNHFVHGSESKLSYEQNLEFMGFFTEALQFVFAASDLVECGWDVTQWSQHSTTMSHPFSAFRINYSLNVAALKKALA